MSGYLQMRSCALLQLRGIKINLTKLPSDSLEAVRIAFRDAPKCPLKGMLSFAQDKDKIQKERGWEGEAV